ncbi:hypothetical protein L6R53_12345 [Myxococcota bacterium]|nr:hypothetical protein [Myxococcota bacterium]
MSKKQKPADSDMGLGEFDDWFADGESQSFWEDEKPDDQEQQRLAAEKAAAEKAAAEKAAAEKAEQERLAAEKAAAEKAAAEKAEQERLAAEKAAAEKAAAEKAAAEKAEQERLAAEQAAAEQAAAERAAAEQAAAEQAAAEQAAAEQAAAEQASAESAAAEQAAAEQAAAEKAAAESAAAEQAAAEQAAAEQAAAEKAAAESAAAEKAAAESAAAEQAAADQERQALERARAASMGSNPTIVADMDEGWPEPDPETEIVRTAEDDQTEVALAGPGVEVVEDGGDDGGGDEDEAATAEDFLGDVPDPTMILRRDADAHGDLFDEEEVARARAERQGRRAAAPQTIPLAPPPEDAPVRPPRIAPSVPASQATDRWAEAAQGLEREAATRTPGPESAALWAAAGRVHFERLGNWERAEELFGKALKDGFGEPEFLKAFADVVANKGDFQRLRDLLVDRARVTDGALAAEALQDAALVERNSLRRPDEAASLLQQAIERDPQDWFALRLLREMYYRSFSWGPLVEVLGQMAALVSGPRAARVQLERGRVLEERLGDPDGARAAYEAALAASPGHAPAFLAVERLAQAAGDLERLQALYQGEADRLEGPDAAFWQARSLRVARQRPDLDADALSERFQRALAQDPSPELRREQQVFLAGAGRPAELAQALQAEADATAGTERAWALFRLGQLQAGTLDQPDAAVESYRAAAEADPSAGPALEAAAALLADRGEHARLLALLEGSLARIQDPNLVVTTLYRMGELCEGPLADQAGARTWFERVLETAPGYLPALEGLERVYTRLEAWDRLAAVYEQRAILAEEPAAVALQLHRAGAVCDFRLGDIDRARSFYQRALENVPDFPPSLDAYVRIMEADGDWAGLARALRAASEATRDANEVVSLTYRAARILADRVGDPDQAMALLRRCLELSPGFLPAIQLLRELASRQQAWQDVYDLHRLEADAAEDLERRHWRMLAAALVAARTPAVETGAVVGEILEEDAAHVGALRLLEERALAGSDPHETLAVYQRMAFGAEDEATRVRMAVRVAELAADAGDAVTAMNAVSEVISAESGERPLLALARLAERANYWEEAQRALLALPDGALQADLARIQEAWLDDASAAARTWQSLLDRDPADVEAAAGLERSLARAGKREGLARAHGVLADHLPDRAVAAVHALLAGHLFEADGDMDQALVFYGKAFDSRPVPGKAFDALRRVLAQRRDVDGLVDLFGRLAEPSPMELAASLEEAGAEAEAAARYRAVLADADLGSAERLAVLVRLEQALVDLGEWKELFEVLGQRLALCQDAQERTAIEARRRWVLAEHLAQTDEAWDFYRQLHEQAPEDTEVLEALARIAGARGETRLAIQYLGGLAAGTREADAAARYQRRIAEAWLAVEDQAQAREALMRALDHEPTDLESLRLLKQLAVQAEDWPAVVGALARESTVLSGAAQAACYREIAATWQDRIGNHDVAADAWRKVLEVAPDDVEALRRLVDLAREKGAWSQVVEHGGALARSLSGPEQSALLSDLGRIQLEHLHREDEAVRLLDAASKGGSPDLQAARLLEKIHASRGHWDRVADAVTRQAQAAPEEERVALLLRAAEIQAETLHDRAAASDAYARVLEVDPDNVQALRYRGDHCFEDDKLADAVSAYERLSGWEEALDLDDFDDRMEAALYNFRFAEALRRLGRDEDALVRYQKALSFNQSHLPSLEAVGPILIAKERWEEAATVYRELLQLIGGQGDAERLCRTYTNLGTIELHQGALDKAKKRFTRALDLKANDIGALQGMAAVLMERKDWNNLLNVYNNIIYHAQEPADVVDAYITKGFILDAKMNLPEKAAQHYEKSLAFNPAQPNSLLRLAELALRRQDWPEAGSLADRGLVLDLEAGALKGGLWVAKAVAHAALGDQGASQAALRSALEADPSLAAAPGADASPDQLHQALKERLQQAV